MSTPRVAIFSLGGTIAMVPQPGGGVAPALSANDLLAAIPGLAEVDIAVEVHDFRQLPGASLSFADLVELYSQITEKLAGGVDGVVITQGTDTLEETALLLDLLHADNAPVVLTGAMRSATVAGADGPANVLGALRTAASANARGLGALVVFADEIHAARFVRKTHATSVAAFTSQPGALGSIVEDQVRIRVRPPRLAVLQGVDATRPVHTTVAVTGLGDDGSFLRVLGDHADGLVIGAFGAGHVPAKCIEVLTDLASRIPVVLTSRTGAGSILSHTYGFPGSESDLLARGLISSGALDPIKARILLQLLLMADADRATIEGSMREAGGVDDQ